MKKQSLFTAEKTIKRAAQAYYTGNPIMSDDKFDELVEQVRKENPDSEVINKVGWGYNINAVKGVKIKHLYGQVGSLDKIHAVSELPAGFDLRIVLGAKLDGASCVAYYDRGVLVKAVSRGDGEQGVDCTDKYRKIVEKNNLDLKQFTGAVRGEIVFSNENWQKYLIKYPDAKFPRNVATGLFMRDDISEDLDYVSFVAYKIHGSTDYTRCMCYLSVLDTLKSWGFDVVPYKDFNIAILSDDYLFQMFNYWVLQYPIDGIVIYDNTVLITSTGQFNYKNIAYKFKAEEKETTVQEVEWCLSKNNIMIPVIRVDAVSLSGAIVNKTSGFNYEYITKNKIGPGSKIKLMRSGEVIPYITEVLSESDNFTVPSKCPVCGENLEINGVELLCVNANCRNVEQSRLINWVQTIGVRDMLGIGPAILEDFVNKYKSVLGFEPYIEDMYDDEAGFVNETIKNKFLELFTPAIKEKLKQVIDNLYKPIEIHNIIYAMNIRGLGETICKKIADIVYTAFKSNNTEEQDIELNKISKISGIGLDAQNRVKNARKVFTRLLYKVPALQLNITQNAERIAKIVVTGSLSIPRKQFDLLCFNNNIELSENITGSNYLVTNNPNSGSSKLQKATKLGIQIISEQEFYKIFNIAR